MPINPNTGEAAPRPIRDINHRRHRGTAGAATRPSEADTLTDAILHSGVPEITAYTGRRDIQEDVARTLAEQALRGQGGEGTIPAQSTVDEKGTSV